MSEARIDQTKLKQRIPVEVFYRNELGSHIKADGKTKTLCPFHNDVNNPNLVIFPDGGFKCFRCNVGGGLFTFYRKLHGKQFLEVLKDLAVRYAPDLISGNGGPNGKQKIIAEYPYHDESGEVLYQVVRFGPVKDFRQRRPDSNGGWIWKMGKTRRVLYRLPELINPGGAVYIPGGEKDVDTLRKHGFIATTNPGGEGNWRSEFTPFLKDREVIILEDNDTQGRKHGKTVAKALHNVAGSIKIVRFPEMANHGDVSDFLENHTGEEFLELAGAAPLFEGDYEGYFGEETPHDSGDGSPEGEPVEGPIVDTADREWEKPVLDNFNVKDIPSTILPDPYREYSSALSNAMEVPSAMTVAGVFGMVSAAVSHRFYVSPKPGWKEPINVYFAVAIDPGNLKSPTQKKLIKGTIDWEIEQAGKIAPEIKRAASERKTREKLIDHLRTKAANQKDPDLLKLEIRDIADMEAELEDPPVLPKVFATDTTPEQLAFNTYEQGGKFAVISDEGGIMKVIAGLYSRGNANIDIVLKGIDGGPVRIRRKERSFDLNPILTFCLFCQPSVIKNMGRESAFDGNGLVERFMYLLPESRLGYRSHENEPLSERLQSEYDNRIKTLLNNYMVPEVNNESRWVLELDPEAFREWRDFQDHIETQLRPGGKLYPILGWGGKICGYALRLAGLLHVMEYGHHSLMISLKTMDRALEFSALLVDHALAAFNLMGVVSEGQKKFKALLDWIQSGGKTRFRRRDCLRDLHGRFKDVKELEGFLKNMDSLHIISPLIRINTGGAPGIFHDVNPRLSQEVD